MSVVLLASYPASAETVAHWRFEEKTSGEVPAGNWGSVGDTVLDSSGRNNHLQTWDPVTAPAYTNLLGPLAAAVASSSGGSTTNSSALDFAGQPKDLFTAAKPLNTQTFDAWTIEASFMLNVTGRWQVILGKDGNPVGGQSPLSLKVRADNRLEIGMVDGSGVPHWVVGTTHLEAGRWYQAAATASAYTLSLWLKPAGTGAFISQGSTAIQGAFFNSFAAFNQPWIVGRGMWAGWFADWTDGRIDEVRISDVALPVDQFLGAFTREAWLDDDADGYTNLEEYRLGTNPAVYDDLSGKLSREIWFGIGGEKITDLLAHPAFAAGGQSAALTEGVTLTADFADNYGQRLRGWVTAPVTGNYTFWVSGDDECELALSSTDSKFDRTLIARVPEWTFPHQWDKYPSQKSVQIPLVAGQRYFIEALQKDGWFGDSLSVAWQIPGGSLEVIPPEFLTPYGAEPADEDMDELPDSWELAAVGNLQAQGALDNFDHDFAPNWEEIFYGTNPSVIDSNVGYWNLERWYDMPYFTVPELVGDRRFYGPPHIATSLTKPIDLLPHVFVGTRVRGYVEVDETAEYRFWISGRSSADLLLSTDDTPYRKRRIAYLGVNEGTGTGVPWYAPNLWDVFISQMSEPVRLEAGRKYYLEAIRQNAGDPGTHLQIAWAKIDGPRSLIATRSMSSFAGQPGDADDDSLPDDWEAANGLDPSDNGFGDLGKQGERGDFDGDGLNNREEFLAGTDPTLSDTDGDGVSDWNELRQWGTDPLNNTSLAGQTISNLSLTPATSTGIWVTTPDGVKQDDFRGSATWNFTVPSDGVWLLEISAKMVGKTYGDEELKLVASIDGNVVDRSRVIFRKGVASNTLLVTPRLSGGTHELKLLVDNYITRRKIEIQRISVIRPVGSDNDGDGTPDQIHDRLGAANQVYAHPIFSHVSPYFIEGAARDPQKVDLTVIHPDVSGSDSYRFDWTDQLPGLTQQLDGYQVQLTQELRTGSGDRLGGTAVFHEQGAGEVSWYSNLELDRNDAVGYVAHFENHEISQTGTVVWTPYNVLDGGELTIRPGSKVLLGAWATENDTQPVTLQIGAEQVNFLASQSHVQQFDIPGSYTVVATHPDGRTGTLTIRVKAASFGNTLQAVELSPRDWAMDGVAHELALDAGEGGVKFTNEVALPNGGTRATVQPTWPGAHRVAARLWENGPVVATGSVNVMAYSDALRNDDNSSIGVEDGVATVRSPLVLTNLPEGGYARVTIFRAGVTFTDGSTEKIIHAGDLDANGQIILNFLFPLSIGGGFCHYIDIYDANGFLVRRG